jgi:ABC-type multidrug transport system fused ATPase/permease subunit
VPGSLVTLARANLARSRAQMGICTSPAMHPSATSSPSVVCVPAVDPAWSIVNSFSELQRSERVFEILDMEVDKPDRPGARKAPRRWRYSNSTFSNRISRTAFPVVRDFTVRGGSVIALVDRSGAWKTTLTDLVARFHVLSLTDYVCDRVTGQRGQAAGPPRSAQFRPDCAAPVLSSHRRAACRVGGTVVA